MSDFVVALVSAHSTYGSICIDMLVQLYVVEDPSCQTQATHAHLLSMRSSHGASETRAHSSVGGSQAEETASEAFVRETVHETLYNLMCIAPVQSPFITKSIRKHFPHKWAPVHTISAFTQSVLELQRYLPELSQDILAICVERMIDIDVDIKDEEDETDAQDADTQFLMETGNCATEAAPDLAFSGCVDGALEGQETEAAREKLDGMMALCLETVHEFMSPESAIFKVENGLSFFELLWYVFQRTILPTHQVKHVQFLLFYACRCVIIDQ